MNRPGSNYLYEKSMIRNVSRTGRWVSGIAGICLLSKAGSRKISLGARIVNGLSGGYLLYRGLSGNCLVKAAWNDSGSYTRSVNIRSSIFIDQPPEVVYSFWRDLANLQRAMNHIDYVEAVDQWHAIWILRFAPHLPTANMQTEIVHDIPNRELSWQTMPGSDIFHAGKLEFIPLTDNATRLEVMLSYKPAGGAIGETLAHAFTPLFRSMVKKDIKRVKSVLEKEKVL